ncbi:MAG: DUF58 domain-containing protein [Rhizobacter sp.]
MENQPASDATPDAILRRLEWTVIRRQDGVLQGDYRTLFRGAGLDLADLREYQHHDDVRHIDWNVTARLQQPYVREFTEDRELTAWFLLDLSGSVDFGSARTKRSVSVEFVTVLSRLLTRHGNRVGAMLYGNTLDEMLPARNGRTHVLHLLQRMLKHTTPKAKTQTQLQDLLLRAAPAIPRRSTVFVVSDFISAPGWEKALAQLSLRHEVLAVRLYDPLEMALPDLGLINMQDAETGEQILIDTHDPGFRARFARAAEEQETALRDGLARAGVDTLELATDEDLLATLLRFVELRKQRVRMASGNMPSHLKAEQPRRTA